MSNSIQAHFMGPYLYYGTPCSSRPVAPASCGQSDSVCWATAQSDCHETPATSHDSLRVTMVALPLVYNFTRLLSKHFALKCLLDSDVGPVTTCFCEHLTHWPPLLRPLLHTASLLPWFNPAALHLPCYAYLPCLAPTPLD